jgi:hypothetical protein
MVNEARIRNQPTLIRPPSSKTSAPATNSRAADPDRQEKEARLLRIKHVSKPTPKTGQKLLAFSDDEDDDKDDKKDHGKDDAENDAADPGKEDDLFGDNSLEDEDDLFGDRTADKTPISVSPSTAPAKTRSSPSTAPAKTRPAASTPGPPPARPSAKRRASDDDNDDKTAREQAAKRRRIVLQRPRASGSSSLAEHRAPLLAVPPLIPSRIIRPKGLSAAPGANGASGPKKTT